MLRLILRKASISHFVTALRKMAMGKFICEDPIVVIVGATGAGKSKLALELGRALNGEIVSADSMQVYKGLDIITNKVTEEEQKLCRHHLIGFLSPSDEYTIVDFQKHARDAIADIHSRKKLPIICGGTSYYIESILWEFLTSTAEKEDDNSLLRSDDDIIKIRQELESLSTSRLYKILEEIDPERAAIVHPNSRRRIIRSVEVFQQSGQKHSDLIKSQTGDKRVGGELLYKNICFIWVQCDEKVLRERVEKRVDKMMAAGLLFELEEFHKKYNEERLKDGSPPQYGRGIFQSIGFKEFHKYLTEDLDMDEKKKCVEESLERMKLSTWQYAKYQIKWLQKRIVNRQGNPPVYSASSTNPSLWDKVVYYPSLKLLQTAINWGGSVENVTQAADIFTSADIQEAIELLPIPLSPPNFDDTPKKKRICELCGGKVFLTDREWEVHVMSRRHKRSKAGHKRRLHRTLEILCAHERNLTKEDTAKDKEVNLISEDTALS